MGLDGALDACKVINTQHHTVQTDSPSTEVISQYILPVAERIGNLIRALLAEADASRASDGSAQLPMAAGLPGEVGAVVSSAGGKESTAWSTLLACGPCRAVLEDSIADTVGRLRALMLQTSASCGAAATVWKKWEGLTGADLVTKFCALQPALSSHAATVTSQLEHADDRLQDLRFIGHRWVDHSSQQNSQGQNGTGAGHKWGRQGGMLPSSSQMYSCSFEILDSELHPCSNHHHHHHRRAPTLLSSQRSSMSLVCKHIAARMQDAILYIACWIIYQACFIGESSLTR